MSQKKGVSGTLLCIFTRSTSPEVECIQTKRVSHTDKKKGVRHSFIDTTEKSFNELSLENKNIVENIERKFNELSSQNTNEHQNLKNDMRKRGVRHSFVHFLISTLKKGCQKGCQALFYAFSYFYLNLFSSTEFTRSTSPEKGVSGTLFTRSTSPEVECIQKP